MFDGNRKELEAKLILAISEKSAAEARAEAAKEIIKRLEAQVDKLQDALVAAVAPRAYEDKRSDLQDIAYVPSEESKQNSKRARINGELLWQMEQPAFRNADDMISALTGSADFGKTESIHGNSES